MTESRSVVTWGLRNEEGGITEEYEGIWGVTKMFTILIVVTVSQVYTFVKLTKLYTLNMCVLLLHLNRTAYKTE